MEHLKDNITLLESEKRDSENSLNKKVEKLEQSNKILQLQIDRVNKEPKVEELIDENAKLKYRLDTLKQNVFELKNYLEKELCSKLELKSKCLKEALEINHQLEKKIELLESEDKILCSFEDQMHLYRTKYNEGLKEKIELQKLNQKQESTIQVLEAELASLEDSIAIKDTRLRELNKAFHSLSKHSNESNKVIISLKDRNMKKETEDKGHKILLYQKEQEILLLKNLIKSNKSNTINSGNNSRSYIDMTSRMMNKGISYSEKKLKLAQNKNNKKDSESYRGGQSSYKKNYSLFDISSFNNTNNHDGEEEKIKDIRELIDDLLKE